MEFPRVLKKQQADFQGVNYKQCGISTDNQEKIMWNFQGSWFQVLKRLRGVTQFCGISRGEALFCLEFPWIK